MTNACPSETSEVCLEASEIVGGGPVEEMIKPAQALQGRRPWRKASYTRAHIKGFSMQVHLDIALWSC